MATAYRFNGAYFQWCYLASSGLPAHFTGLNKMNEHEIIKEQYEAEEKKSKSIWLWFCLAGITAFLLSSTFLVALNTGGDLDFKDWSFSKWVYAGIAVCVTAIITAYQYYANMSGKKGWSLLAVIILPVLFSAGSEIASFMQREGNTVNERSVNSSEYKEAINGVNTAITAGVSKGASPALLKADEEKSDAAFELHNCKRHEKEKRRTSCESYESKRYNIAASKIKTIKGGEKEAQEKNSTLAQMMLDKSSKLAHNENYHYEVIKLIMSLGFSALAASFIFNLLIIFTFEFCFHKLGVHFYESKTKLEELRISLMMAEGGDTVIDTPARPLQSNTGDEVQHGAALARSAPVAPSKPNGIGFTAHIKGGEKPKSSVPVQDSDGYKLFIKACIAECFCTVNTDFNVRLCRDFLAVQENISKVKAQNLASEWIDKAGRSGVFVKNENWKEDARIPEWRLK